MARDQAMAEMRAALADVAPEADYSQLLTPERCLAYVLRGEPAVRSDAVPPAG